MSSPRTRGLTLIEMLVVMAILIVGIAILLPSIGSRPRIHTRSAVDANNVRNTLQALTIWAQNNRGSYPLPSVIDVDNATLDLPAHTKDATAGILSLLIFNGHATPQQFVSSAEVNPLIQRFDNYQYTTPSGAAKPADALWDPAFRGTPDDPTTYANIASGPVGHQSYAHVLPFGKRRKQWADTYNSTEPVFGNRGPTYAQSDAAPAARKVGEWSLLPGLLGTQSNTLLIHGGRNTWEGNIGYNDNHVNFETSPTPDAVTLFVLGPGAAGKPGRKAAAPDNLFVNETNEHEGDGPEAASGAITSGTNAYLRPIAEVANPTRPRVWRD